MDDPLDLGHFGPICLAALLLVLAAALPRRPRILRQVVAGAAPLMLCAALLDRGEGAGFRWSMYFLVAPAVVFMAGQLIWRGRWGRGRRSFTFLSLLLISAANLVLIPPIFFAPPDPGGPGARWIVWMFAWMVLGVCGSFHLLLRQAAFSARDR